MKPTKVAIVKVFLMALFGMGLVACDSRYAPLAAFDDYQEALSRSQWVSIEESFPATPIPLPELRQRQYVLSEFDVGLLDFLSLQQCDVGLVAGKRNSILGKVMPPSQRLIYELEIIRAIESCDVIDDALHGELLTVAAVKRQELPLAYFNSLWAGEEAKAFFSLANGYIPMSPAQSAFQPLISTLADLTLIQENLATVPQVSSERFEAHQKVLLESEYAGRLLVTIQGISQSLNQVTAAINPLANQPGICGAPLTFLKTQFETHYVKVLQPYMARIQTVAYRILPELEKLLSAPKHFPTPEWQTFAEQFSMTTSTSVWSRYQAASRAHAKAWSTLFSRCQS
ncbi:DUF3080 domain-containing protein [Maribrevibacterium harenarium]|uniref:DUF3080 domain-containing protein n=1 Tax=Maribrevibacterium harenarium TaxID=2589817 RepID=A0A501X3E8_9GAMM|nr:DUF3080 family protein [Maribrevibacterium harenarium]TPE54994.1 DUF3080 domain-containing protein [Maribrevibacterium harenarium]